jgi:CHASE2 domain-containing sensor protein
MQPLPKWFTPAAIAATLWMAFGCFAYITEMTATPAVMAQASAAERAIMEGRPAWSAAAFAIAVWGGLLGTLLLVLRRALALPLLWLAFAAMLVSYLWPVALSEVAALFSGAEWGLTAMIVVAQAAILWLGTRAKRSGWLR